MDLYDAFLLGGDIEYIKNVSYFEGEIVKERGKGREIVLLDIVRRILRTFVKFGINGEMQETIIEWITKFDREYKAGETIRKADAKDLSEDGNKLEQLIFRELRSRPIVELTRKGALSQEALLDTSHGLPSSIFDKEIWQKLPLIAKNDFSDAAKCLLVEASTPATMVALRGIEAVMRDYYRLKKGHECGKKALGVIIKELRSLSDANIKLLGYVDYLRSEKRNLAQHPDKTFTQKEAERIFMEIINAVHDISSEMIA